MSLSLSARLRRRIAMRLWPPVFEAPPTPALEPPPPPAWATYVGDGLATAHNSDFLEDECFRRAYAAGKATGSWWDYEVHWRAYVVCWAARLGLSLPGDYVECGVYRGGYSRMLAEYVDLGARQDKKLYLVDTYCGVPKHFISAGHEPWLESLYPDSYADVVRTFADFANAVVVRGEIPDVLREVRPQSVCYLSIDLNCVEPSISAAEHFWPLMSTGAAMVLDDYGFAVFHDQKVAFDAWAARHGVEILTLPTGQGLLIKPPAAR
jgi:O-methyltransferase